MFALGPVWKGGGVCLSKRHVSVQQHGAGTGGLSPGVPGP